jgi:drug/metabolite transporter (DMT)-like permease
MLGLLVITVTQGAQFVGLSYLPAITVSLLLNFTPIIVALLGIVLLAERPTSQQWGGIALYLLGILIYFYPIFIPANQLFGLAVVIIGVLTNAISSILGRSINRERFLNPLLVTVVSMGVGSITLLVVGLVTQGLPPLSPLSWLIIAWLAVVNTALAFPLWNATLRVLPAVESSIINSTMLAQVAILAWLFLGEPISAQQVAGMALAGLGVLAVQIKYNIRRPVRDALSQLLNYPRVKARRQDDDC